MTPQKKTPRRGDDAAQLTTKDAKTETPAGDEAAGSASVHQDLFARVPQELKALPRWLVWKYLPPAKAAGKRRKKPWDLANRCGLDGTRVASGLPFGDVLEAYRADKGRTLAGIGLILGDGIGGTDCDDCIGADGALDAVGAAQAAAFAGTYIEVSPSGEGFKSFCLLDERIEHVGRKVGQEEIYSGKRWFAVTGNPLARFECSTIADKSDAFLAMVERIGARNKKLDNVDRVAPADAGEHFLRWHVPGVSMAQAADWLHVLDPDVEEPTWFRWMLGWALQFGWEGFEVFDDWSSVAAEPGKYPGTDAVRKKYMHAMERNDRISLDAKDDDVATIKTIRFAAEQANQPEPEAGFDYETGRERMERSKTVDRAPVLGAMLPVGVTLIAGMGGTGKTTIAATAAAHVSNGRPLPPWERPNVAREPGRVLWLTVEEDLDRIVLPRHIHLGGDIDRIIVPKVDRAKDEEGHWFATDFDIEKELPLLLAKAKARGQPVDLVVADSLPGLVQWGNRNATSDAHVKKLIGHLNYVTTSFGCSLLGIAHWNKKTDLDEDYRTSGAQAWRDTPRVSFTCKVGSIRHNKVNDVRPIGCTFLQEVVAVLYSIEAVTENDEPLEVTARRAVFGASLVPKAELQRREKEAEQADTDSMPSVPELTRRQRMARAARFFFDSIADEVDAGDLWTFVMAQCNVIQITSVDKVNVEVDLKLSRRRAGKRHLLSIA